MDIHSEKLRLIELLLRVKDVRVVEQVGEALNKVHNPIVGYEADGRGITQHDFIKAIEQAENEYSKGTYQSVEEVEKESEDW